MKTKTRTMDIGVLFIQFLQRREKAEASLIPAEKADAFREAVMLGHQIIERLALFGAAINANFSAIHKKLEALNDDHPEVLAKVNEQIGSLIGLRNAFLRLYADEASFAKQYERRVRDRLLQEAGIDPADKEAAMAHLLKLGQQQIAPILNPVN